MFIKRATCPACQYSLPLCCSIYKITLPPRTISCPQCKKSIRTTFEYRTNWIHNIIFQLAVLGFFVAILYKATASGVPLIAGLFGAAFFGVCFGGVTALMIGFIAAPLLQLMLEGGHATRKIAAAITEDAKPAFDDEEQRLRAFLKRDKQGLGRH